MKQKQKDGERKRERARGIEEKAGRRGKRLRSEKHVCPRKRNARCNQEHQSSCGQTE